MARKFSRNEGPKVSGEVRFSLFKVDDRVVKVFEDESGPRDFIAAMAQVLRPAASEVRSLLRKIKSDNMASGRALLARLDLPDCRGAKEEDLQSILWLE